MHVRVRVRACVRAGELPQDARAPEHQGQAAGGPRAQRDAQGTVGARLQPASRATACAATACAAPWRAAAAAHCLRSTVAAAQQQPGVRPCSFVPAPTLTCPRPPSPCARPRSFVPAPLNLPVSAPRASEPAKASAPPPDGSRTLGKFGSTLGTADRALGFRSKCVCVAVCGCVCVRCVCIHVRLCVYVRVRVWLWLRAWRCVHACARTICANTPPHCARCSLVRPAA